MIEKKPKIDYQAMAARWIVALWNHPKRDYYLMKQRYLNPELWSEIQKLRRLYEQDK